MYSLHLIQFYVIYNLIQCILSNLGAPNQNNFSDEYKIQLKS